MTTRAQGIGCDLLPSVRLSRSSAYESRLLEGVSREALMIRSRWSLGTRTRLGNAPPLEPRGANVLKDASRWSLGARTRLKMSPAGASGRDRA